MSLAQIILLLSWIGEGNLKEKFSRFIKNKTALAVCSLFVLHAIGMLYTTDLHYGLEDLKKKIPLFLLPLLFSTSAPLPKVMFDRLISVFALSVISASFICFFVLLGYSGKQILHPQEASIFISHIRFGLLIGMTFFILGYFFSEQTSIILKIISILLMIWLIAFLIMMESATGLICIFVALTILLIKTIFLNRNIRLRIALAAILLIECIFAVKIYYAAASDFVVSSGTELKSTTASGNTYTHNTLNTEIENGNFVWRNICEIELEEAWNKRSNIKYDGKDLRNNDIKYTLIRFLTSKGLMKDAEGVNTLSKEEQESIEKGIANVNFVGLFNPTARLQKIMWEFDIYSKGGNPSGHSVVQRLEFSKAAIEIIKENPIFGVGTGDVKNAFESQYEKMNSPLTKEWRLRSHNQFLAITVGFGIAGLILFLTTLFYPLLIDKKISDYLYLMFFVIAFLSMFPEDTLENQAGVTFFAFFNSLFLFLHKDNQSIQ